MIRLKNKPLDEVFVTSPFGKRNLLNYTWHAGIDLRAQIGTRVYAMCDGYVNVSKVNSNDPLRKKGYGEYIVIDHEMFSTLYAHLESRVVAVGDYVKAGDLIGFSGCTGVCNGAHLHLEIRDVKYGPEFWKRDKEKLWKHTINPLTYLNNLEYPIIKIGEKKYRIILEEV